MTQNFTVQDLCAGALATLLLGWILFAPGYVLGYAANWFQFRDRTLPARGVLGVMLGLVCSPLLVFWVWRYGSLTAVYAVVGAFSLAFVILAAREAARWRSWRRPDRSVMIVAGIAAVWTAVVLLVLADLQIGDRLYFASVSYDYTTRAGLTDSISRTGIPPENPFFFPGHGVPLRYHYFLYLLCSLTDLLGGPLITARQSLMAAPVWAGLGLLAAVAAAVRLFLGIGGREGRRVAAVGCALLGVTGADLAPVLMNRLRGFPSASLEWWNETVMAWVHGVLWVPHHLVGLVHVVLALLALWTAMRAGKRLAHIVLAGLGIACGLGTSVYITFVFCFCLLVWGVVLLWEWKPREFVAIAAAGVLAGVFAGPYLWGVRSAASTANPMVLTVRHFGPVESWLVSAGFAGSLVMEAVDLLLLPLNYALELGFFGLAGIYYLRKLCQDRRVEPADAIVAGAVAISLLLCSFLSTRPSNDLGWRGMLIPQFMLLLWAARLCADRSKPLLAWPGWGGRLARGLLLLGLAGSVFEIGMVRFVHLGSDLGVVPLLGWLYPDRNLGNRTWEARQVYARLQPLVPQDAVVQSNPDVSWEVFHGLYADRRTAAYNRDCVVGFGGTLQECLPIANALIAAFRDPQVPADSVAALCRRLRIRALVFKDIDPVWAHREHWIWRRKPAIATNRFRVFLMEEETAWQSKSPL